MEARVSSDRHRQHQQKPKEQVDTRVAAATEKRGILIVFTGNGKGRSAVAFDTVARVVSHGKTIGIAQFTKGQWDNGEHNILHPLGIKSHIMGTGFTWEAQNRQAGIKAATVVWLESKRMPADVHYDLAMLDEFTYMLAYHYPDTQEVINAIESHFAEQSAIVTERGCRTLLPELAGTASEIRPVGHTFDRGIQTQIGIDQ